LLARVRSGRGAVDPLRDHAVELRPVERCRLEVAFLDATHAGGLRDPALAGFAAHQHTHVCRAVLDAGIGEAHVVDAQVARLAGRHLILVPEALLGRDHYGSIALQRRELRRIERGPRMHVRRRLVNDGGQLGGFHVRENQHRRDQGCWESSHHAPPD